MARTFPPRNNAWNWYLFALCTLWDAPYRVRVRYRFYRRHHKTMHSWLRTYPWWIATAKVGGWWFELGNHWKTEKVYLVLVKGGNYMQGGDEGPKFYYWINPHGKNNKKGQA